MKRIIKTAGKLLLIVILAAVLTVAGLNWYVCSSASGRIMTEEEAAEKGDFDCILVLGCAVHKDGTPSPMLRDRVEKGISLYRQGAAKKLLMSGDHGRDGYNEVQVMKDLAMEAGIPEEDIFMDHAGFSTYESMYRAGEVFRVKRALIVTQEYHLYRGLYVANRLGIDAYGVAADGQNYRGQWSRDLREAAARVKDVISVGLKVRPKYLGEPIPVSGNGMLTNDT